MKLREAVSTMRGLTQAAKKGSKPSRTVRECEECGELTDRACVYCKMPLCTECSITGECYHCLKAQG